MFHEERLGKVEVIYQGASYSGVLGPIVIIGRANGDGIAINPTPVPLLAP